MGEAVVETKGCDNAVSVCSEPEFDFLSDEYQHLFSITPATAFQSPHWLSNFYKYIPKSVEAEPVIITVRSVLDQSLLLVLPLVRQRALVTKIVQPADLGISDYNTVLAAPETIKRLSDDEGARTELKRAMEPYDILLFRKQRPDTNGIQDLLSNTQVFGRKTYSYAIDSSGGFDSWVKATMSAKHRSSLRRKVRSLNRDVGELVFETATKSEDIREAFNFLRAKRTERYSDDLLNRDAYFEFYENFALTTAASGSSLTHIGRINGVIASAEFGPVHNNCFNMILAAFNETDYSRYSVGILSMMDIIEQRLNLGERRVDFTTGAHEYKRRFKANSTELQTYILTNGPLGTLTKIAYSQNGQLKQILKKISPRIR